MADTTGKEKTETLSAAEHIAVFIQNNRFFLIVLLVIVAAGIAGFITFYAVRDVLQKEAIVRVEEFERRLEEIEDPGDASKAGETQTLLDELNEFAPKSFGYAAGKAYSLAASIHAAREEWAEAEKAYLASARKADRIYLAPLSMYNAAVAAEEQGRLDEAASYYGQSLNYSVIFPAAVRAQFAIGRLHEEQNNKEAALDAYRLVIEKWPDDITWTNFAHARIISLGG
ncbi:MAG: tetratricopeptide repeat protein [Treponema sp.]|nr:tetratricopeptide repeat protein [Treponema sp.]